MKFRTKLLLTAAALLLLAGCGKTNAPENTYQQITQEEAAAQLGFGSREYELVEL